MRNFTGIQFVDKATDARPKDLTDIDQLEIKKKDKE
jgi:hypothetical protein